MHKVSSNFTAVWSSFALTILCFFMPSFASAATLSLDPSNGKFGPGDMFVITLRLETALNECVNAATVNLDFAKDWMKVVTISKGESLMTLWPDEPKIDQEKGKISFSAGIPAGYCGRVQGDPGKTNILAKIVFSIPGNMIGGKVADSEESMGVTFATGTQVLLNDGFGTAAHLEVVNASFTRLMTSSGLKSEWLDIVHSDDIPPDPFSATVEHDPNILEGKYFLVFSTVDKQSGIMKYEVNEDDPLKLGYVRGKNEKANFVEATSPYLLADQELKSRITVRAFDQAGNSAETIVAPLRGVLSPIGESKDTTPKFPKAIWWLFGLIPIFALAGAAIYLPGRRKEKSGKTQVTTGNDKVL